MRRLYIIAEPVPATPSTPASWRVQGDGDGLDQIADYARRTAVETGETVVAFEIFWPWESEESNTWDAVQVDTAKIDAADWTDWWIKTLPPYADLTVEQRQQLGIEVPDGDARI